MFLRTCAAEKSSIEKALKFDRTACFSQYRSRTNRPKTSFAKCILNQTKLKYKISIQNYILQPSQKYTHYLYNITIKQ